MATVVNGTNFRIYASGIAIGEATNCTMSLSTETRETLTKDNVASYTSAEPGRRSGTLQSEGLIAFDTTNLGIDDLFTHYNAGTKLVVKFQPNVTLLISLKLPSIKAANSYTAKADLGPISCPALTS